MSSRTALTIFVAVLFIAVGLIACGALGDDSDANCSTTWVFNGKQNVPIIECEEK